MISEILKSCAKKDKVDRELSMYKRYDFMSLYYQFDEKVIDKYDSPYLRKKWKELLLDIDFINSRIWYIAKLSRQVQEWNIRLLKELHKNIFDMLTKTKYIYERIMWLVNTEKSLWQNMLINVLSNYKLNKEDVYELMPYSDIESFKILLRQIFRPVMNLMLSIENDLIENNSVDTKKLRQLEEEMFISVLPWLYNVYETTIELQGDNIW